MERGGRVKREKGKGTDIVSIVSACKNKLFVLKKTTLDLWFL